MGFIGGADGERNWKMTDDGDFFRQVLDAHKGIVYVYDIAKGSNVYANERWVEDFGYSLEETRASGSSFLPSILHPDDLDAVRCHHKKLMNSSPGEKLKIEYRLKRNDNSYAWLSSEDSAFKRDATGTVTHIVGFAHDISEQKEERSRRAVAEVNAQNEATLREAIIDNAVEGICVCEEVPADPGIRFSVWNQQMTEISGYTMEEINRLGWYQTVYKDTETQARAADRMERMRLGENLAAEEWVITRKDGEKRTLLISTRVILLPNGSPKVLGVMHDVSERVLLEGQLRDAQRMEAIGRLAGAVAHDFNNTLAIIMGGASLLDEGRTLNDVEANTVRDMIAAADRGADLTRQLLTFSRRQRTEMKVLDLGEQIVTTMRIVGRLVGKSVQVETELEEGCFVRGDSGMLDQVVMNLVLNARDAMSEGGTIRLSLRRENGATLEVSDTGAGIEAEELPHIFEPFFTTKDEDEGTGLGLAIVYGIVTQHEGTVSATSTAGEGTTIRIELPLTEALAPQTRPRVKNTQLPPMTILLVEDQAPVRRTVRSMLEAGGHRVFEAESGERALSIWEESAPEIELLLTDVSLGPGLSGPETYDRLALMKPTLPAIFMSGFDPDLASLDLKLGHDFLQKPFSSRALADLLVRRFGPETRENLQVS